MDAAPHPHRLILTAGQAPVDRRSIKGQTTLYIILGQVETYELQDLFASAIYQTIKILLGPKRDFRQACRIEFDWVNDSRLGEYDIKACTRFDKKDYPELAHALGIPTTIRTSKGDVCSWQEGVLALLYGLSFPNTWDSDQLFLCGQDQTASIRIFYYMVEQCYSYKAKLDDINLWADHMDVFVDAIAATGGAVIGFIDGTFSGMCRPGGGLGSASSGGLQRECYNGHFGGHGLKYQAVILPNGMFSDLYGVHVR